MILAAGSARRLLPHTQSTPKSLLPLDHASGLTFLGRLIGQVRSRRVSPITVVTGFCADKIVKYCQAAFGPEVQTIHNADFATTNNEYSLFLTAKLLPHDDSLVLDADVLCGDGVLDKLLDPAFPNAIAVNTDLVLGTEEMKVDVDNDGYITSLDKKSDPKRAIGESTGLQKFSREFCSHLVTKMHERVVLRGLRTDYCDASFAELMQAGERVKAIDIRPYRFIEYDTYDDYLRAIEIYKAMVQHLGNSSPNNFAESG